MKLKFSRELKVREEEVDEAFPDSTWGDFAKLRDIKGEREIKTSGFPVLFMTWGFLITNCSVLQGDLHYFLFVL